MADIAIVGMAGRFPGAKNLEEFWKNLSEGKETTKFFTKDELRQAGVSEDLLDNPEYVLASPVLDGVDLFDAELFGYSKREAEFMDPQQRIFLECAWEAIESAGYASFDYSGSIGVFAGSGGAVTSYLLQCLDSHPEIRGMTGGFQHLGNDKDFLGTRASYKLNLRGPSVAVQTACSTSLVALHMACQSVLSGECDMALAGGVSVRIPQMSGYIRQEGDIYSVDGHCRAFDADATGIVFGSGVGLVLVKSLEDAIASDDHILAVIKGSAINNDGAVKMSYTASSAAGQIRCITEALTLADVDPSSIQMVEAHGTGTTMGDPVEVSALTQSFRNWTQTNQFCAIGSVKTNLGHLDVAAGITSLIKVILSLYHKQIPPSINFKTPNPKIEFKKTPFFVAQGLQAWEKKDHPRRAAVNGLGIGGTNAFVVLEEAPENLKKEVKASASATHLLILSAKSVQALRDLAQKYIDLLARNPNIDLASLCSTAALGRNQFEERLSVVTNSVVSLKSSLTKWLASEEVPGINSNRIKDSSGLAFLFSGQGSQFAGMGKQLYDSQPVFKRVVDHCEKILSSYLDLSLTSVIWGENQAKLNETKYTQPSLFVLEYALAELWKSWGILPTAVMGHSVGELVAACVAGVFSLPEGLKLIAKRGELMQKLTGDCGMGVIAAPGAHVADVIKPYGTKLSIAAFNGPTNTTISGDKKSVREVLAIFGAKGLRVKELAVSHGFHSSQMDGMLDEFEKVASEIKFASPKLVLISNLTGARAKPEEVCSASYWRKHVREAVKFEQGIKSLWEDGNRRYVEIGPGTTLVGMGQQCTANAEEGAWIPSFGKELPEWDQVLEAVGMIFNSGVRFDWKKVVGENLSLQKMQIPVYPFQRKKYWIEASKKQEHGAATPGTHPLLGSRLNIGGNIDIIYQKLISTGWPSPFLQDHFVFGTAIVPAAAFIDLIFTAVRNDLPNASVIIEGMLVEQPLLLFPSDQKILQIKLMPDGGDTSWRFQVLSQLVPKKGELVSDWVIHAQGKVSQYSGGPGINNNDAIETIRERCKAPHDVKVFYKALYNGGLELGPKFRGITTLLTGENEAVGRVELVSGLEGEAEQYTFHPTQLDSCQQVMPSIYAVVHVDLKKPRGFLPVSFEKIILHKKPKNKLWSHVLFRSGGGLNDKMVKADVRVLDDSGELVVEYIGKTMIEAPRESLMRMVNKKEKKLEDWFYQVFWRDAASLPTISLEETKTKANSTKWLVLSEQAGLGHSVVEKLKSMNVEVFELNSAQFKDYDDVAFRNSILGTLKSLYDDGKGVKSLRVLFLWASDCGLGFMNARADQKMDKNLIVNEQKIIYWSALSLVQEISKFKQFSEVTCNFVTRGAQSVREQENHPVAVSQSTLWGLRKVIGLEQPDLHSRIVDLDPQSKNLADETALIIRETIEKTGEEQIAIRNNSRKVLRLAKRDAGKNLEKRLDPVIHDKATYLVTGGLGGIGLQITNWLVNKGAKSILLVGRSLPSEKVNSYLTSLRKPDVQIRFEVADISSEESMGRVFKIIDAEMPPLKGVIHAAGVLKDGFLAMQDWSKFEMVMLPKIIGVLNLHQLTSDRNLEFFCCFSSATSVLGNIGQANYAAANAFLDAFSYYRKARGQVSTCINWGPWAEVGMLESSSSAKKQLEETGFELISVDQGLLALEALLGSQSTQVGVF